MRIAICAAMRWELRPVLRALPGVRRLSRSRSRTWLANGPEAQVLVFQTGIGMAAATTATNAILQEFEVDAVINTGCAGALRADLPVGALVCGSTLLAEDASGIRGFTTSVPLTSALIRAADAAGIQATSGALLTSPDPLPTRETKQAAFDRYAAAAVEMEGMAVARAAQEAGVQVASIRAILDELTSDLPAFAHNNNTALDFPKSVARTMLSAEEAMRFSRALRNAVVVERTLGRLFKMFFKITFPCREPN